MTDEMFDEKGLRTRGETDPEKPARRNEDAPDVEGHRFHAPEELGVRKPRGDEPPEDDEGLAKP